MDIITNPFDNNGSKKLYGKRSKYHRIDGTSRNKSSIKSIRIGGGEKKKSWKIKVIRRLRLKMVVLSPLKLWCKLKNAYLNMMLGLAGNVGYLNHKHAALRGKRIPKARQVSAGYSNDEFESRLVYEIYKNMIASRELATT